MSSSHPSPAASPTGRRISLRARLLLLGLGLCLIPLVGIGLFVWQKNSGIADFVTQSTITSARSELDQLLRGFLTQAELADTMLAEQNRKLHGVAVELSKSAGGFSIDQREVVAWTAVNQVNQLATTIDLPKFLLGDSWLGKVDSFDRTVPLVDTIAEMTGDTATIFQRMNEQGDFLRVATSVRKLDGKRAIGTYIPGDSPVAATVMRGETYIGRAFVVNQYYSTAYSPIRDPGGRIIGALYVGVPEVSASKPLRESLMATVIGETGYPFVLNTKGDTRGVYAVSQRGERDGESVLQMTDSSGRRIIEEMVRTGEGLKPRELATLEYQWRNPGELGSRTKITHYAYFAPWDWLIAVGSYEDEFMADVRVIQSRFAGIQFALIVAVLAAAAAATGLFVLFANRLSASLMIAVNGVREGSSQIRSAADEVATTSQNLAEGANEQAAAIEQSGSALEELTNMMSRDVELSVHSLEQAEQVRAATDAGVASMRGLRTTVNAVSTAASEMELAMQEIRESSGSVQRIIKTIDEIAFQTNILALNAAVEAARAGEAGAGFAVVADEVRSLAKRAADAAKETSSLIEASVERSERGATVNAEVGAHLQDVLKRAAEVDTGLGEISAAVASVSKTITDLEASVREQQSGVQQINTAISQVNDVTQRNAANAEEAASSSEQMNAQAVELQEIIATLSMIVRGGRN